MSELEKATYDRGFYNGIREARQIFAKHLNASTSTDEIKWDNVSKTEILSEIDNFMMKNESYPQPQLTIPKSIADELEEEIEEAYSNNYIRSYSDVGAYMEVITNGLDEDSELYKFMFPDNDALLGCSHRNIIYLYLVDNDLVKVVEG